MPTGLGLAGGALQGGRSANQWGRIASERGSLARRCSCGGDQYQAAAQCTNILQTGYLWPSNRYAIINY